MPKAVAKGCRFRLASSQVADIRIPIRQSIEIELRSSALRNRTTEVQGVLNSRSAATIVFRNDYRRYSTLIPGIFNLPSLLVNEQFFWCIAHVKS